MAILKTYKLEFKMKEAIEPIVGTVMFIAWLAGIVLAKGWYKLLAFLIPPYGWYIIVERIMQSLGIVGS